MHKRNTRLLKKQKEVEKREINKYKRQRQDKL